MAHSRARLAALLSAACVSAIACVAQAEGVAARLVYTRAPEAAACPNQAALEQAVAKRLGYSPFYAWAQQTIVAEVRGHGDSLQAHADLVDGEGVVRGSRRLSGRVSQCEDLVTALALAISITLDPMSIAREPAADAPRSDEPPLAPTPPSQPAAEAVAVLTPNEPRAESPGSEAHASPKKGPQAQDVTWGPHAGLLVLVGALPQPTPGGYAGLHLSHRAFFLGVEGAWYLPASRAADVGGEVEMSLVAANVFPCLVLAPLAGCAVGTLGRLHGVGRLVTNSREESRAYVAVGLRALATVPLGARVDLVGQLDGAKTLTTPTFQLGGQDVWEPAPWAASAGVALALTLR